MTVLLFALQAMFIGSLTLISFATGDQGESFWSWSVAPAVFAAVGTVLAFGVTFALFLRGSRDQIREQATTIYITRKRDNETGAITATVHNASQLPIWGVEANPMRAERTFSDGIGQPGADLAPGGELDFVWISDGGEIEREWRLRFIDAADRAWIRVGNRLRRDRSWRRR